MEIRIEPHAVLGLSPGCSLEEARRAYYELVKWWHPDQNPNIPKDRANQMMARLNAAWAEIQRLHQTVARSQQSTTTASSRTVYWQYDTGSSANDTSPNFDDYMHDLFRKHRTPPPEEPPPPPKTEAGWRKTRTGGWRNATGNGTFTVYQRTRYGYGEPRQVWRVRVDRTGQREPSYPDVEFPDAFQARSWCDHHPDWGS